jgi:hypothetical protein
MKSLRRKVSDTMKDALISSETHKIHFSIKAAALHKNSGVTVTIEGRVLIQHNGDDWNVPCLCTSTRNGLGSSALMSTLAHL